MKPSSPGVLFVGSVCHSYSISLLVIGSVQLICFFLIQFSGLWVSQKLSISSRLSNQLACNRSQYSLTVFGFSSVTVEISPFSFLILFIWVFLSLVSLARCLSISFTFSKNQLLVFFIFFYCFFEFLFYCFPLWSLWFPSCCWLWVSFVLLFLILLGGRLSCWFEIFLFFWGRPVLLWTSL